MKSELFRVGSIILTSFLCYINSFEGEFVFDDREAIKNNLDLRPSTPIVDLFFHDFWGRPMDYERSHGSYRPLCTISFRLNYFFSELNPRYYHVLNSVLHVLTTTLIYFCFLWLSISAPVAWMAALIFAVHPIHTEAVSSVVGRAELLSAMFFCFAVLCYISSSCSKSVMKYMLLFAAMVAIPLATLSKETGITVSGLLIFYEMVYFANFGPRSMFLSVRRLLNKDSLIRVVAVITTTACILYLRLRLMSKLPKFSILDNPATYAPPPIKQLTYAYLVPVNTMMLLYPWPLVADWSLGTIPLISGWWDPRNIASGIFFLSLFVAAIIIIWRLQSDRTLAFCFALTVVPFVPASNLFFPVGFVVAERVLYLPSFGWCGIIAIGFERLLTFFSADSDVKLKKNAMALQRSKFSSALCFAFVVVVVSFFLRTFLRNYDWANQKSIFQSGIRFNQRNAKIFNNIGHTYEEKKMWHEAFAYFYKAARIHPFDVGAHRNVARTLRNLDKIKFSERALKRAYFLAPTSESVLFDMALMYYNNLKKPEKSLIYLEPILRMSPNHVDAWGLLGFVHLTHTLDLNKAAQAFKTLIRLVKEKPLPPGSNSPVPSAQYHLCRIMEMQSEPKKAMACLENMLKEYPGDDVIEKEVADMRTRHPEIAA